MGFLVFFLSPAGHFILGQKTPCFLNAFSFYRINCCYISGNSEPPVSAQMRPLVPEVKAVPSFSVDAIFYSHREVKGLYVFGRISVVFSRQNELALAVLTRTHPPVFKRIHNQIKEPRKASEDQTYYYYPKQHQG
jgi:hypothetical protein